MKPGIMVEGRSSGNAMLKVQLPTTTSWISLHLSDTLPTGIFSVWVHDLVLEAANESSEGKRMKHIASGKFQGEVCSMTMEHLLLALVGDLFDLVSNFLGLV